MASAGFANLCAALCITGIILSSNLGVSHGDQALDCCLQVSTAQIPKHIIVSYREQFRDNGCAISAVIFKTIKGKNLCAPHDMAWVKDLKTFMDTRLKKCQENKFKGKHCRNLKPKSA